MEQVELQQVGHVLLLDGRWYEVDDLREADPPFGRAEFAWLEWTFEELIYTCPISSVVALKLKSGSDKDARLRTVTFTTLRS